MSPWRRLLTQEAALGDNVESACLNIDFAPSKGPASMLQQRPLSPKNHDNSPILCELGFADSALSLELILRKNHPKNGANLRRQKLPNRAIWIPRPHVLDDRATGRIDLSARQQPPLRVVAGPLQRRSCIGGDFG